MYAVCKVGCVSFVYTQLLNKALAEPAQACFINQDVLRKLRGSGGVCVHLPHRYTQNYFAIYPYMQVRIEDDILVTATGAELLTDVPRTVEEVEAWMQRGEKTWTVPTPT